MPVRFDIVGAAAEQLEGLVDRAVEQHVVIGHVEMAVVVDPARLDPHHRGDERGEENRFEVDAIEHAKQIGVGRGAICRFAGVQASALARQRPCRWRALLLTLRGKEQCHGRWPKRAERARSTTARRSRPSSRAWRRCSATGSSPRARCASSTPTPLTWVGNQPPDAVVFPQIDRGRAADRAHLRRASRAGHPVRHRHLARRPRQRAAAAASRSTSAT